MDENIQAVETNTQQAAVEKQEVKKEVQEASAEQGIDYTAELEALKAANEKLETEKENYKRGMLLAKKENKSTDDYGFKQPVDEESLDSIIDAKVAEKVAAVSESLAKPTIDQMIVSMSDNQAERDLIKYHYEKSIQHHGVDIDSIQSDLENAKVIANKKAISSKMKEMAIALNNKSQISNEGMGNDVQQGKEINKDYFTAEQLAELKRIGVDPNKVKENILKNKNK